MDEFLRRPWMFGHEFSDDFDGLREQSVGRLDDWMCLDEWTTG